MSITNYSELQAAITSWSARNDLTNVADFISLSEAMFNRELRTRWQETSLTSVSIASYAYAIPATAVAIKHLWPDAYPNKRIEQKTLDFVIQSRGQSDTGIPRFIAWSGSNWQFDASGTISGVYYAKVPALSGSNTTNWLLTDHPDLYLVASLARAATWNKDFTSAAGYEQQARDLIVRLNESSTAAQASGGKLVARAA